MGAGFETAAARRQLRTNSTNNLIELTARADNPGTCAARSIAPHRLVPLPRAHVCICFTLESPMPRVGTLTIRASANSSAEFAITRRYASVSLISFRL